MGEVRNVELKIELEDGEPPTKRAAPSIKLGAGFKWNLQALANAADAVESGGKSPVSALNELGVRVNYTILRQGGPAHCPSFTVSVTVADMTFEGWGHSKRDARAAAARACLAALLARAGRVLPAPTPHQDFTSDEPAKYPVSEFQCLETKMRPPPPIITNIKEASPATPPPLPNPATALFGATNPSTVLKSPINVLYENYPGLSFNCTFGDGSPLDATQANLQLSHSMRFKVVCQIKEQKFEGYGSSKKLAKLAAARSALAVLEEGRVESPAPAAAHAGFLPQTLADHIGKLVNEKFNEVMHGDLVHSKRKVLAGIVITVNHRIEGAKVIAVTTGTKCVSGEHMSVRGRAVNDCHAEVAARRCLQRHLYAQLLKYASAADPRSPIPDSDLEPSPGGGYQMKRDRQVHLYVSTAPCGDSRIFSPHEQPEPEPDRHPNRLARGQLRTKIESGEGTIPVKNCDNTIQTWDGVMQGERLLTMSCSDKVARWCVVGLQGALLSRVLKPVYLHSLVLGSLLHVHHMYRALCGRIETYITCLPPPFQLRRPLLARAASTEARTPARAPSFSVCWCRTTPQPEIINATTGILEGGQPSLLCKQSMFARWQYIVKRLPLLPDEAEDGEPAADLPSDLEHLLYNEAKQLCPTYQVAKECLFEAFEKAKLGRWIKKPLEQDQFICEIANADPQALFAWAGPVLNYSTVQCTGPAIARENDENEYNNDNFKKHSGKECREFDENGYNDVNILNGIDFGKVNEGFEENVRKNVAFNKNTEKDSNSVLNNDKNNYRVLNRKHFGVESREFDENCVKILDKKDYGKENKGFDENLQKNITLGEIFGKKLDLDKQNDKNNFNISKDFNKDSKKFEENLCYVQSNKEIGKHNSGLGETLREKLALDKEIDENYYKILNRKENKVFDENYDFGKDGKSFSDKLKEKLALNREIDKNHYKTLNRRYLDKNIKGSDENLTDFALNTRVEENHFQNFGKENKKSHSLIENKMSLSENSNPTLTFNKGISEQHYKIPKHAGLDENCQDFSDKNTDNETGNNLLTQFKSMAIKDSETVNSTKSLEVVNTPSSRNQSSKLQKLLLYDSKAKSRRDILNLTKINALNCTVASDDLKGTNENLDTNRVCSRNKNIGCKSKLLARKLEIMNHIKDLT